MMNDQSLRFLIRDLREYAEFTASDVRTTSMLMRQASEQLQCMRDVLDRCLRLRGSVIVATDADGECPRLTFIPHVG